MAVVALTWWLLLGWSWPHAVYGFDDVTLSGILAIREMVITGDGWTSLVYRPDLVGGVKVANVAGRFPLYSLGARLGLPVVAIVVFSAFIVQALLGWLACRTATDITRVWSVNTRRLTRLECVGVVWLCAFAPVLGWRFGVGHPNHVVGLLPFATSVALVSAAAARTTTVTLIVGSIVAIMLGLLHVGQQIVVYGAVFGLPVLLGLWISLGGRRHRLAVPAVVVSSACLLALPALWGILAQARSSDSPRVLGESDITYGFVTATGMDWLTSLPWMRPAASSDFHSTFAHEMNYPVGPLVVLLALLPWRRAKALVVGVGFSVVVILVFSMDLAPVSRALIAVIPPLSLFRVPARAALVVLWALPIIAIAALMHRRDAPAPEPNPWTARTPWLAMSVGALLFLCPPLVREVAAAVAVALITVLASHGRRLVPVAIVLIVLGLLSVAAFGERLAPYHDVRAILARAEHVGAAVRAGKPELESALNRVRLDFDLPPLATNTAFAAQLSSLDGYVVAPTARFSALVSALRGERYEPTRNFFRFTDTDPALPVLRQLYNETHAVTLREPRSLVITPLGPTAGAAWFSASAVSVNDVTVLARELRAAGGALHVRARDVLWRNHGDPIAANAPLPPTLDARCREARVAAVHAPRHGPEIVVAEVASAAVCPLTFAMNFSEDLRAVTTLTNGARVATPVFPGYGSLATVLVPDGANVVSVRAEPVRVPWALLSVVLGLTCAIAAVSLVHSDRDACS